MMSLMTKMTVKATVGMAIFQLQAETVSKNTHTMHPEDWGFFFHSQVLHIVLQHLKRHEVLPKVTRDERQRKEDDLQ